MVVFMHKNKLLTACGSKVEDEKIAVNYDGTTIYFCEKECLDEFNENPVKFINSDHLKISLNILNSSKS